jgi:hypothetical protein
MLTLANAETECIANKQTNKHSSLYMYIEER